MLVRKYSLDSNFQAEVNEHKRELELNIKTDPLSQQFRENFDELLNATGLSEINKNILAEQFYSNLEELQIHELLKKRQVR